MLTLELASALPTSVGLVALVNRSPNAPLSLTVVPSLSKAASASVGAVDGLTVSMLMLRVTLEAKPVDVV